MKKPVELVTDKLIMSPDELRTYNSPRQIDHPKCTILVNETVVLDVTFQNYFQESLWEDGLFENCLSGISESIKSTFTMSRYLK